MSIKKNSAESQLYNKPQVKYNYANRYDKKTEYRLKKSLALKAFLNNNIYGNRYENLNIFCDNTHSG
jgi:hypothetical protein